jgi:hypothetical protein
MRLDLTYSVSGSTAVTDASIYSTGLEFRGCAHPGDGFNADQSCAEAADGTKQKRTRELPWGGMLISFG